MKFYKTIMKLTLKTILSTLIVLFVLPLIAVSQKKLTNQDIWYSRNFSVEYVTGGNSMNDGEHYSVIEHNKNGNSIVQYSYIEDQSVEWILDTKAIKNNNYNFVINDYSFKNSIIFINLYYLFLFFCIYVRI